MKKREELMLQALIIVQRAGKWIPTRVFKKAGISKNVLDDLEDQGKLKAWRRRTKYLYVKRTDERYFDPAGKDTAINNEISRLLDHMSVEPQVRNIVTSQLNLQPTTSTSEIYATFLSLKRVVRARLYNTILKEVQRQNLVDPLYDYQTVAYHTPSNYYKLSDLGEAYLNSQS